MHIRCWCFAVMLGVLCCATEMLALLPSPRRAGRSTPASTSSAADDKPTDKAEPFSAAVAERLMRQVRDGLIAGNADTVLAAFDRDNMAGYREFAAQLQQFLSTWESIRIHYQILESAEKDCPTACGTATVQFEMEADNVQSQLPATRRAAQLQLTFQRGDKGWKIIELTPRDIFQ